MRRRPREQEGGGGILAGRKQEQFTSKLKTKKKGGDRERADGKDQRIEELRSSLFVKVTLYNSSQGNC